MWRLRHDDDLRMRMRKAYNDRSEWIVGRRLLDETPPRPDLEYPERGGLHDVFEAENIWHAGSWWLQQSATNLDELKALLDRVEARLENGLRDLLLPDNWEAEKTRLMAEGVRPRLYRGQRGPVTFAASIYGAENLIFLIMENPDVAIRFRDLILRSMLEIGRIFDEEAGYTPETAPHGFSFADDNSMLLNPDMYELFGYPILKAIFERYSPDPGDRRHQHSDSPMGHLLPILGRVELTSVNFGPTVMADDIRRHLPQAVIHGVLAPFVFMRNQSKEIVRQFRRDYEMTKTSRGLVFATAGSINNGSSLASLRLIMSTIQCEGRYA
jgi:uroporphyrinogen decarboxylase